MALRDWIGVDAGALDGGTVVLRPPRMSDHRAWADLRAASRDFLQPWEPAWAPDDLTRGAFRRRLSIYARDRDLGLGYAYLVFEKAGGALVGGVNLRGVTRGVAQSAAIGYWAGQAYARRGHTLAGVCAVTRFALRTLGLHRVEAACCTDNIASSALLRKVGFTEEGMARGYLKINGIWRDHLLFGMVGDETAAR